jgi:outer membrane lipoprotein-sorting protein
MSCFRLLSLASCLAVVCPLASYAQEDDAKAVLRKAIDAHGGEKLLLKYQAVTYKFKGNMEINGQKLNINGEFNIQKPDKLKSTMTIEIMDKMIPTVQVFNGKTLWISAADQKTMEVKNKKVLAEFRANLHADGVGGGLIAMFNKTHELSPIGIVKVKDQDAIGIRVSKKGDRDISLFFDKKTHQLVKSEMRALDLASGQEVSQESFFSDFKKLDGITSPTRAVAHKDGKLFMEYEITDTQFLEKLDDATFAMP